MALVAFGWSVAGSFHFDDYSLFSSRAVVAPAGLLELLRPLQSRPLTYLTFWVDYQTGGASPLGWHVVNLLLHVASVLLAFAALRRLMPERAAMLAAALFAVHPLNAEAVNYIFARGTLLCTLLTLASLRSWVNGRHWHAVAWFASALLAKEECVTFPLFLLLLSLCIGRSPRPVWKPIAAMLGLSLLAGVRVLLATLYTPGANAGSSAGVSAFAYLASEGPAILRYLRLLLIPAGLTVDPDLRVVTGWPAWLAWLVVLALCAAALRLFSGLRAGFWFLAGLILLLPSSSIFPAADLAADRRMYLPMVAFASAGAMLLYTMRTRALVVICASLAAIGISRCEVWRTELSLWTDAVRLAPDKLRPRIQLARALPPDRALSVLDEAESMAPGDPDLPSEQGRIYLQMGDAARALSSFGRALALNPASPLAINNRGAALLALGQTEAARLDFERALAIDPCQPNARLNLRRMGIDKPAPPSCPADLPLLATSP
ncbi:MAG: tetratricopeptide repeat protein [Bryobacteraceae bacterium]